MRSRKKRLSIYFSGLLMVCDIMTVFLAFTFSYFFRFYSGLFPVSHGIPSYQDYFIPLIIVELILVSIVNTRGLYRADSTKKFIDKSFPLVKSIATTMLFVFALTFFYRSASYSRLFSCILLISLTIFLVVSRYFLHAVYAAFVLPVLKRKILIVGKPEVTDVWLKNPSYFNRYTHLEGVVSIYKHAHQAPSEVKVLGLLDDFETVLDKVAPDEVVLADLSIPRKKITELILNCEKRLISFKIVADLLDIMIQQFELENVNGLNLIKIKESPLTFAYNRVLKRVVDVAGSLFGLALFSPLYILVALMVKRDSPGPVFFAQDRISEDGRTFKIYKFRTMRTDAEGKSGPVFAKKDDDRCTRLGAALRKYNIDELPQLMNVLKGEMSLVGPRPERPNFVEQFKDDIPRYMSRHHVKAGITGWAQINGLRQGTAIDERVKYDLFYLENWSLWLDLKIIFLSVFALKRVWKNAY